MYKTLNLVVVLRVCECDHGCHRTRTAATTAVSAAAATAVVIDRSRTFSSLVVSRHVDR